MRLKAYFVRISPLLAAALLGSLLSVRCVHHEDALPGRSSSSQLVHAMASAPALTNQASVAPSSIDKGAQDDFRRRLAGTSGPSVGICLVAPEMRSRVAEARTLLHRYYQHSIAGKATTVSLWSLMSMAHILPLQLEDQALLGDRPPFVPYTGWTDSLGGVAFISDVTSDAKCRERAPICLRPTFPLLFDGVLGEARPEFPRHLAAMIVDRSDDELGSHTDVVLSPSVHIDISMRPQRLPSSLALDEVDLGDKMLRYHFTATGAPLPAHLDMQFDGVCHHWGL